MRIAHINAVSTLGTGRVALALCRLAVSHGHKALICHASRDFAPSDVPSYRIGGMVGLWMHVALARLTDRAGFFSRHATRRLVKQLEAYRPDIVHLHDLHGYYLHLPTLFDYLKRSGVLVVWTLHDCWPFTGHCAHPTMARNAPPSDASPRRRAAPASGCDRWLTGCGKCAQKRQYPASLFWDNSARNYADKRRMFTSLENLVLTAPSQWLGEQARRSFLSRYPLYILPNGLDLSAFRPCADEDYLRHVVQYYRLERMAGRPMVLSVAPVWDERQGLEDLISLSEALGKAYCVVVVGLDEYQREALPPDTVLGVRRLVSQRDLRALYTMASVFVSASHEEGMGTTLLEALACGTQVLCYAASALPEILTPKVGRAVPVGDITALAQAVRDLCQAPLNAADCRARASQFDEQSRFLAYLRLYENMYHSRGRREAPQPPKPAPRPAISRRLRPAYRMRLKRFSPGQAPAPPRRSPPKRSRGPDV